MPGPISSSSPPSSLVTGFILPAHKILPAHVLSLIALAIACVSRCSKKMQGSWLKSYVFTAMISLYFNVLVRSHNPS